MNSKFICEKNAGAKISIMTCKSRFNLAMSAQKGDKNAIKAVKLSPRIMDCVGCELGRKHQKIDTRKKVAIDNKEAGSAQKTCVSCNETKYLNPDNFGRFHLSKDGFKKTCLECQRKNKGGGQAPTPKTVQKQVEHKERKNASRKSEGTRLRIKIDFTKRPELYDFVVDQADKNIRTNGNEILSMINTMYQKG